MYQVLYRKWRPQTFSDVSGQEHITTTLRNELKEGRLNHAYLFTGSRGTGKTTCAKILAKAANCLNLQDGNPCGECEICRGIDDASIFDIVEMDAASNRKIDDIRQIIDEVQFKPASCKYRVYIVDEVHMLTTEAFNALLKTLEEPPKHVIFILATTEVHKLPQTILSRCQRFDFHRIPPRAIADRLLFVAQQEEINLSDSSAMLIAGVADGALRDALSLLDRCIAINPDVTDEVVRTAAGLAGKEYLYELAVCVINKNTSKALEIIDRLYSESKDMSRLCDELVSHFRALMLIKSVSKPRDIIVMSDSEFEEALTQSDYLSIADIVYYMDVLSRAYQNMGHGTGDRTELEMAMVKLSSPELDATTEALTARITALEKAVKKGITVNYAPTESISKQAVADEPKPEPEIVTEPVVQEEKSVAKVPVTKPAPKVEPTPVVKTNANLEEIYRNAKPYMQWVDVVNNFTAVSSSIAAAFAGSLAYESGNYLLIDINNDMAFQLLKNPTKKEEIRRIIYETTGKAYSLGPYKKPQQQTEQQDPLADFKKTIAESGIEITEE